MTHRRTFLELFVVFAACRYSEERIRDHEILARPVLIPGYRDFQLHGGDGDYNTWVWSYALPAELDLADAIRAAKNCIQQADTCYSKVLREDARNLTVRCGSREYRLLLDTRRRRMFMLHMTYVPTDTARYVELSSILEEALENFD